MVNLNIFEKSITFLFFFLSLIRRIHFQKLPDKIFIKIFIKKKKRNIKIFASIFNIYLKRFKIPNTKSVYIEKNRNHINNSILISQTEPSWIHSTAILFRKLVDGDLRLIIQTGYYSLITQNCPLKFRGSLSSAHKF